MSSTFFGIRQRSQTQQNLHSFTRQSDNPLEDLNLRICVFRKVEEMRKHALLKQMNEAGHALPSLSANFETPTAERLEKLKRRALVVKEVERVRTFNGLPLIHEENTVDASVKMLVADLLDKAGMSVDDLFDNLPSTIIPDEERKNQKSIDNERIYESLKRIIVHQDDSEVIRTSIPSVRPIKALATAIERHGSLILSVSKPFDPHHYVIVDNIVKMTDRRTVVNPVPLYGVVYRDPLDGTHALANAGQFVKYLQPGDTMFQLSFGIQAPITPNAPEIPLPGKIAPHATLGEAKLKHMMGLNEQAPTTVARLYNTAIGTPARPASILETIEPINRRRMSDGGMGVDLSSRFSVIGLDDEHEVILNPAPTERRRPVALDITQILANDVKESE